VEETRYLVYITQQGQTVWVSYADIKDILKRDQLRLEAKPDEVYWLAEITFQDGQVEQQAISDEVWQLWFKRDSKNE